MSKAGAPALPAGPQHTLTPTGASGDTSHTSHPHPREDNGPGGNRALSTGGGTWGHSDKPLGPGQHRGGLSIISDSHSQTPPSPPGERLPGHRVPSRGGGGGGVPAALSPHGHVPPQCLTPGPSPRAPPGAGRCCPRPAARRLQRGGRRGEPGPGLGRGPRAPEVRAGPPKGPAQSHPHPSGTADAALQKENFIYGFCPLHSVVKNPGTKMVLTKTESCEESPKNHSHGCQTRTGACVQRLTPPVPPGRRDGTWSCCTQLEIY